MAMHDFVVCFFFFSCPAELFSKQNLKTVHFLESMDILPFALVPGFLEIMDKK